jgi:hypothetical protein
LNVATVIAWHAPATQLPAPQEWPHFPQLAVEVWTSTQASPQSVCVPQLGAHLRAVHATVPPAGAVHLVHASPHASTVSPAHDGVPELVAPLLLALPELPPLDDVEDEEEDDDSADGSSPTHAPTARRTKSELVERARTVRIPSSYHQPGGDRNARTEDVRQRPMWASAPAVLGASPGSNLTFD